MAIKVFIGLDDREAGAIWTCASSIVRNSSEPVEITPLYKKHLGAVLPQTQPGYPPSNDFIFSRFLVPSLCDYHGHALFLDGDMILRGDIAELWHMRDHTKAVQVVQHDYKTNAQEKYLGAVNRDYPRKNWSSVILWNCAHFHNRKLSPEYVRNSTGAHLHRFEWIDPRFIGSLPKGWNYLEGEPNQETDPEKVKLVHWTLGGPYFKEYADVEYAEDWQREYQAMTHVQQRNNHG